MPLGAYSWSQYISSCSPNRDRRCHCMAHQSPRLRWPGGHAPYYLGPNNLTRPQPGCTRLPVSVFDTKVPWIPQNAIRLLPAAASYAVLDLLRMAATGGGSGSVPDVWP